jgi:hypothetical protein
LVHFLLIGSQVQWRQSGHSLEEAVWDWTEVIIAMPWRPTLDIPCLNLSLLSSRYVGPLSPQKWISGVMSNLFAR